MGTLRLAVLGATLLCVARAHADEWEEDRAPWGNVGVAKEPFSDDCRAAVIIAPVNPSDVRISCDSSQSMPAGPGARPDWQLEAGDGRLCVCEGAFQTRVLVQNRSTREVVFHNLVVRRGGWGFRFVDFVPGGAPELLVYQELSGGTGIEDLEVLLFSVDRPRLLLRRRLVGWDYGAQGGPLLVSVSAEVASRQSARGALPALPRDLPREVVAWNAGALILRRYPAIQVPRLRDEGLHYGGIVAVSFIDERCQFRRAGWEVACTPIRASRVRPAETDPELAAWMAQNRRLLVRSGFVVGDH
jgi:hypothetical protein